MAKPLGLTDSQYDAVVNACAPLAPADRSRFLVELAALPRNEREVGDGTINQAVRVLLPRFFRPLETTPRETVHHRKNIGPPIL